MNKAADYWNKESRRTPKERSDEMLGLILDALMPELRKPAIREQEPHPVTDGLEESDNDN